MFLPVPPDGVGRAVATEEEGSTILQGFLCTRSVSSQRGGLE